MTRVEMAERRNRIDEAVYEIVSSRRFLDRTMGYLGRAHVVTEYKNRFAEKEFGRERTRTFLDIVVGKSLQRLKKAGRIIDKYKGASTHWEQVKPENKSATK